MNNYGVMVEEDGTLTVGFRGCLFQLQDGHLIVEMPGGLELAVPLDLIDKLRQGSEAFAVKIA